MAHVKAGATTKGNRDSISKRLGVKLYGGMKAKTGSIIIRQRGTKFHAGTGTMLGRDHTIFAAKEGTVSFKKMTNRTFVQITPA